MSILATFQLKDQWKTILHIGDIVWIYLRKGSTFIGARMAEWSKAPDLRSSVDWATGIVEEFGCSGLLVEAWVRIPLLWCFHIRKQQSSLVVMPTVRLYRCKQLMQLFFQKHPGVQIVDLFPKSIAHFHKFKTTAHEIESFFATVKHPFGPFCRVFSKGWRSVQWCACFPLSDSHIGWF